MFDTLKAKVLVCGRGGSTLHLHQSYIIAHGDAEKLADRKDGQKGKIMIMVIIGISLVMLGMAAGCGLADHAWKNKNFRVKK